MFFGLDGEKALLILLIAVLLVGPERLPRYAEALGRATRRAREWASGARERVRDEMGQDFDDIEWRKLDPRQYDPRRIIRDALLDDAPVPNAATASPEKPAQVLQEPRVARPGVLAAAPSPITPAVVPYDSEAT